MQNRRIGSPGEVDASNCASRQIARFGCKERRKCDLEGLVMQKADVMTGVQFDDVERCGCETKTTTKGGEVFREAWNGIEKSFVIVAEWADVLSTSGRFQARVKIRQGL